MGLEELNRGEPQLALGRFESAARRDNKDRALSDDLLAGLTAVHVGDAARAVPHLEAVVASDAGLPDALLLKYAPELAFEVSITPEVSALIPAGSMAAALALIECYQDVGRHEEAVGAPSAAGRHGRRSRPHAQPVRAVRGGRRTGTRSPPSGQEIANDGRPQPPDHPLPGHGPASPRRGRGVRSRPTTSALAASSGRPASSRRRGSGEGAPSCASAGPPRPGRTSRRLLDDDLLSRRPQNTRIGISAGASSSDVSSSSSLTRVIDAPAMSREVQYSPT